MPVGDVAVTRVELPSTGLESVVEPSLAGGDVPVAPLEVGGTTTVEPVVMVAVPEVTTGGVELPTGAPEVATVVGVVSVIVVVGELEP